MRWLGALGALILLAMACGYVAPRSAGSTGKVGPECGAGVAGPDFQLFACMSGGAVAGHSHPKELLVVRKGGSSEAYPAFRVGGLAVGDAKVIAVYNDEIVRVTSRHLVALVTPAGIARVLHRRVLVMGYRHLRMDARGDTYFFVSTLIRGHYGCQNRFFERLAGGGARQLWASSSRPNDTCY